VRDKLIEFSDILADKSGSRRLRASATANSRGNA
jgi:hypothetical protein